jgi:hypothetical protein
MKRSRKGLKLKCKNKDIKLKEKEEEMIDNAKLQKIKKLINMNTNYSKIKYKDFVYTLGDCLLIRDTNEGFLIGKLVKIIQNGGLKRCSYWPTVQIQW